MQKEQFLNILNQLETMGYRDEIDRQRTVQPISDIQTFSAETIWVILNSGMKNQIAKIQRRIYDALASGRDISEVFRHKGKVAAIKYVIENQGCLLAEYRNTQNKIEFLQEIPFIGKITCLHLAKNLGHDCVKPDRHLVRIARFFNTTPDVLCQRLSAETGEKKSVIDIVIWRACNLRMI